MQHNFGFDLPKNMHPEFGHIVQLETDRVGKELPAQRVYELFREEYIDADSPYQLVRHSFAEFTDEDGHSHVTFAGTLRHKETVFQVNGSGNGPIDAFFNAIHGQKMDRFTFVDYKEHAIKQGSDSQAVSYIHLKDQAGKDWFGVGISHNINLAPLQRDPLGGDHLAHPVGRTARSTGAWACPTTSTWPPCGPSSPPSTAPYGTESRGRPALLPPRFTIFCLPHAAKNS